MKRFEKKNIVWWNILLRKSQENGSGLVIFSYCKDSAFTAFKKDSQL